MNGAKTFYIRDSHVNCGKFVNVYETDPNLLVSSEENMHRIVEELADNSVLSRERTILADLGKNYIMLFNMIF